MNQSEKPKLSDWVVLWKNDYSTTAYSYIAAGVTEELMTHVF